MYTTHAHVSHAHRGNLYPPQPHPDTWLNVVHEFARKRVKERIAKIEDLDLQKVVHKKIQEMFPEIRLPDFGIVESDGFRPRYERGTILHLPFEENISKMLEMGIADRARATQALEIHRNNLEKAIAFLLAAAQ